ncbi:MAG: hypothetical protein L6407_08435, partial [Candidatus Delongbacteria bacterium]|nr:hypothetical protein [Candidatus Delongbacteria bacterium]
KAEKISKDFDCGFIEYNRLKNNLSDAFLLILAVPEISQDIKDNLEGVIVFDANYRSSHLKEYCRRYIDGYEWLINQALKSFELFFDIKADARDIKKILIDFKAKRNIAVTGPTGSGKTAYGKNIADHYGMDFIDTDDETEKRTGMKISEIFQTRGEAFFRKIEEEIISDISENDNVIVSIGAGALSSEKNREIIKKNYFTILLDIDPDLANSRLNHTELSKRPLLFGKNLTEILDKMFKERKDHYLSVADIMIKISSNSAEHESGRIIKELDGR